MSDQLTRRFVARMAAAVLLASALTSPGLGASPQSAQGLPTRLKTPVAKPPGAAGTTPATPSAPATSAAKPAAPRTEKPVPFTAGETLTYDVSWSMAFVTAGEATLRIVDKHVSYGAPAYYIVGEGRPSPMLSKLYSLYYKTDTLLDAYTLTSQRASTYSDENGRKRTKSLLIHPDGRTATFEMQTTTHMTKEIAVPAQAQDALSALYAIRALPLKPGTNIRMPVCLDDGIYALTATVSPREEIKTGIGPVGALRLNPSVVDLQGKAAGRKLTIWLSDDAKHVPLRLQAELAVGSFNLVLREAK